MVKITNKKALFDYEIIKKYDAGISLTGIETKSIIKGKVSLVGAVCLLRDKEVFLVNANIEPYQVNNTPKDYDPKRTRRLLLNKKEIREISTKLNDKSLTIIPLLIHNRGRNLKLEIGLAKKKKGQDKREKIKKREENRRIRRDIKNMSR